MIVIDARIFGRDADHTATCTISPPGHFCPDRERLVVEVPTYCIELYLDWKYLVLSKRL